MIPFFFPNVSFGLFDFDIVPFGLVSSIFILALTSKKYPKILLWLWCPTFLAAPFFVTAVGDWAYFFRQIATYITVPLISMATYKAILIGVDVIKFTKLSIFISFSGAIFQKLVAFNILDFFVKSRTTESRGYSSFFVEPSIFGLAMVMFCLIYIAAAISKNSKLSMWPLVLAILSIFLLSQSALAIFICLMIFGMYLISKISSIKGLVFAVSLIVMLFVFVNMFSYEGESRMLTILNLIIESPFDILNIDASISERVFHVYLSIKQSILNGLIPHGFYSFSGEIINEQHYNKSFWWGEPTNKIMSGVGAMLFELGFPSLILPLMPMYLAFKIQENRMLFFIIAFSSILIYLNALTFANPYFAVLIAVLAVRKRNNLHLYQKSYNYA